MTTIAFSPTEIAAVEAAAIEPNSHRIDHKRAVITACNCKTCFERLGRLKAAFPSYSISYTFCKAQIRRMMPLNPEITEALEEALDEAGRP